jgi:hypothetical protein
MPPLAMAPHRELLVPRDAQLAHDEDVERCSERLSQLVADGHAPARQREHDHVVPPGVVLQELCEEPAGLRAVPEAWVLHG